MWAIYRSEAESWLVQPGRLVFDLRHALSLVDIDCSNS